MNLVIVESPAKCQKIQGFLGAGWQVIASLGHIRALQHDLKAIGIDSNFEPSYEWIKEKSKTIAQLKEAAKGVKQVYLCGDKDREGEAISYSVCLLLKLDPKTALRATFTEITETAIKHAIANPTHLDMNQVHAQQARAMLDMMIGFTISPLLWKHVAISRSAKGLSAGRCQTPALRLVMEREQQIENFRSESSWTVLFEKKYAKNREDAQPVRFVMDDELEDEESAVNYLEQVHQQPIAIVQNTSIRPWSESAPLPLITSTFQQQASALYNINPKNAMKIAQKLYEAGHITYMRTDKAVLSEEAITNASTWVKENYGEEYVQTNAIEAPPKKEKKVKGQPKDAAPKDAAPKAQEAHEAIRPTHVEQVEIEGEPYEKKLYKLIWQRTVQSVMSAAKGETCRVQVQLKEDEFLWTSTVKRTTFDGWKRAGAIKNIDLEDEKEDTTQTQWKYISTLTIGDEVKWTHMMAEPKETKAHGRFTEATLVRELEHHGMGRPSTFASLLATIQERGYVEQKDIPGTNVLRTEYSICPAQWPATKTQSNKKVGAEKNKLVPTELGRSVLRFLLQHFDDLFAYGFTATVEAQLDHVAQGLIPWKQVLQDMWRLYKDRYQSLSSTSATITNNVKEFAAPSGLIKAVQSKKGPLLLSEGKTKEDTVFYGWPTGTLFEDMTDEIAIAFIRLKQSEKDGSVIGEYEGEPIVKKTGKFGVYIQCGTVSIPYQEEEVEKTMEKIAAKKEVKQSEVTFKEYIIRTGQYGPYIMKTSLKKPQFVSLPKGVNPVTLTEKEVEALYKLGMETKKSWKKEKKI